MRATLDRPAEWPEHIAGDPEGGDTERDGNDQHETQQPGHGVQDRHPQATEHQPDHVQDDPKHGSSPARRRTQSLSSQHRPGRRGSFPPGDDGAASLSDGVRGRIESKGRSPRNETGAPVESGEYSAPPEPALAMAESWQATLVLGVLTLILGIVVS